jgi:DNA-binding XRE family transcriptional regulator
MTRPKIILDPLQFKRMYMSGTKLNVIAEIFGVSIIVIRKNRKMLNLPLRKPKVQVDFEEFRKLDSQKLVYDKMAKQLNVSRCTVISIRKSLGLPARHKRHQKVRNEL